MDPALATLFSGLFIAAVFSAIISCSHAAWAFGLAAFITACSSGLCDLQLGLR